jgi:glucose/mannose-6-phosphate isomerase
MEVPMLDDMKLIHARDASDALGFAEKQHEQLRANLETNGDAIDFGRVSSVVFAGMGGSALPAVFTDAWPGFTVPFQIVRGYELPKYVGPDTLVITSSYSGNTEETLSAYTEAKQRGAQVAVITHGGKLLDLAQADETYSVVLPFSPQPRFAAFYFIIAITTLLADSGLLAEDVSTQLEFLADAVLEQLSDWLPTVPTANNLAKQIALELAGKSVVVYSGPALFAAANKWKISMNENAKTVAWLNQYPEFNHNEFAGWTSHPIEKPYAVIEIRSDLEHPQVQKRFEVSERLLSGLRPAPIVVRPVGDTLAMQLLTTSVLGDFVSFYLAFLNGIDPTPIDIIEKLKQQLV